MAKISTKELIDEYFSHRKESERKRVQAQVDRPEVYEYEKEIGKQLIEMEVDELFELLSRFNNRNCRDESRGMSYNSYKQISTIYRGIWNYYIDNYEIIRNPWNDKRMKGNEALTHIFSTIKKFTKQDFDDIVKRLYEKYEENEDKAKYLECIMLLYYDGFFRAEEIASITKDSINFRMREVKIPGRTIKLSERCYSLLCQVHNMKVIKFIRGDLIVVQWHDGYFKYIIRPNNIDNFQDYSIKQVAGLINKRIVHDINNVLNVSINYKMLYYLGLYDKLCDRFGHDKLKDLIISRRDSEKTQELINVVTELGYPYDNTTSLKEYLRPYI